MIIKNNRLILDGTPNINSYKKASDGFLFLEDIAYFIIKNSAFESVNKGDNSLFLYKTSFKFEKSSLIDAHYYLNNIKNNLDFLSNTIELTYMAQFSKRDKKDQITRDFNEKEQLFNTYLLNYKLNIKIPEKNEQQKTFKI